MCTRTELVERGVSSTSIDRRIRAGVLLKVSPGVYLLPDLASRTTTRWAAVKAVPSGSLALDTAGLAYGMALDPVLARRHLHVLSHHGAGRLRLDLPLCAKPAGEPTTVVVHESRRLAAADFTVDSEGRRITTPARTVLDLAAVVGPRRLAHIVDQQVSAGKIDVGALRAVLESSGGRGVPGTRRLRELLLERYDRPEMSLSALEAELLLALHRRGLTGFSSQFRPPWYDGIRGTVDFAHVDSRVVIEADSRSWHQSQAAMDDDRRRDQIAASHGWVVLRVTWDQIQHRTDETLNRIADTLAIRQAA